MPAPSATCTPGRQRCTPRTLRGRPSPPPTASPQRPALRPSARSTLPAAQAGAHTHWGCWHGTGDGMQGACALRLLPAHRLKHKQMHTPTHTEAAGSKHAMASVGTQHTASSTGTCKHAQGLLAGHCCGHAGSVLPEYIAPSQRRCGTGGLPTTTEALHCGGHGTSAVLLPRRLAPPPTAFRPAYSDHHAPLQGRLSCSAQERLSVMAAPVKAP